jgi:hypothetical protein
MGSESNSYRLSLLNLTIEAALGLLSLEFCCHPQKRKLLFLVAKDFSDLAERRQHFFERLLGDVIGKISDVETRPSGKLCCVVVKVRKIDS